MNVLTFPSDVLLRHRRRCHPTPPPPDRSSHSPPPPHRGYPGVPISSSRTDARESSPSYQRGRKHPRQSSGSSHEGRGRARAEEDEDSNDDERYAESSRFNRQNGMGNGGVYDMNNYYGDNHVESTTYTPHLLPMFQQTQPFHTMHDENHLEDASVLLSLSYPGGLPSNESNPTVQGQRVVPDWEAGQTINMMMEAANDGTDRDRSTSTTSGSIENPTPGGEVLGESMGNFLGAMGWLGSMKEGTTPGEGANGWVRRIESFLSPFIDGKQPIASANTSPKPLSPFPLSSLFSPSTLGITSLPNGHGVTGDDESNEAVMSILDQLAMYDIPQTRTNPNPERPLLRVESLDVLSRAGGEPNKGSRF